MSMELFIPINRMVGMGRRPRIHFSGAVYHVMARGVDGRDIFMDDHDHVAFLRALGRIVKESQAMVLAYCLMGNHFHAAVQVGAIPLSSIMQRLLTGYSLAFNLRHDRSGHLFQSRYKAIVCVNESYLAALIRYIHQNPVRAGLVKNAQDWAWSSFKAQPNVDADDCLADFNPWPATSEEPINLQRFFEAPQYLIEEIGTRICLESGISLNELRSESRRRSVTFARRRLTQEAIGSGHALNAVASWLRTTASSVSRYSQENTANTGRPDTI